MSWLRDAINQAVQYENCVDDDTRALIRGAYWDGAIPERSVQALREVGFTFDYCIYEQWAAPVFFCTPAAAAKKRKRDSVSRVLVFD